MKQGLRHSNDKDNAVTMMRRTREQQWNENDDKGTRMWMRTRMMATGLKRHC
jgi:hypothetical protein